jgi:hypothetical protein
MIRTLRGWAAGAVLALAVTAGGCAGMGWEDVLDGGDRYGYGSDIRGEVRDVGSRTIELRTENGRHTRLRYDGSTNVRYRDRRYSVRSLERGDFVSIRTHRERDGDLYARSVVVQRSAGADRVHDRRREGRAERRVPPRRADAYARTSLEGRVGRVDRGSGRFELRDTREGTVWVNVPRTASRGMRERISRLREGQHVRLRGRFISGNRFEVEGFR